MKNAKELALLAARALSDKKGKEIQVLEIGELLANMLNCLSYSGTRTFLKMKRRK